MAEKQETKDGLPVTEVTAEQFAQMVKDGESIPVDPLDFQMPVQEFIAELEREIGDRTGNAALARVQLRGLERQARSRLAEKEAEITAAKRETEANHKRVATLEFIATTIKARLSKDPTVTVRDLIDGGHGWAPLPIEQLLAKPDEEQPEEEPAEDKDARIARLRAELAELEGASG